MREREGEKGMEEEAGGGRDLKLSAGGGRKKGSIPSTSPEERRGDVFRGEKKEGGTHLLFSS